MPARCISQALTENLPLGNRLPFLYLAWPKAFAGYGCVSTSWWLRFINDPTVTTVSSGSAAAPAGLRAWGYTCWVPRQRVGVRQLPMYRYVCTSYLLHMGRSAQRLMFCCLVPKLLSSSYDFLVRTWEAIFRINPIVLQPSCTYASMNRFFFAQQDPSLVSDCYTNNILSFRCPRVFISLIDVDAPLTPPTLILLFLYITCKIAPVRLSWGYTYCSIHYSRQCTARTALVAELASDVFRKRPISNRSQGNSACPLH
ncbi:hypothetical protein F4803DRAFT_150212 [Xylaria telfairii]|nr:hypothetical protein F4803DRAFT_150212 [Xylaria telfairii]